VSEASRQRCDCKVRAPDTRPEPSSSARAAINALPKIADNSIPSAIEWAEDHDLNLPFTDFESLKAHAMTTIKDQARYLGDFANFARHASTTFSICFPLGCPAFFWPPPLR